MTDEIVFDLETCRNFGPSRNNVADMGVSVLGAYSYREQDLRCFREQELSQFEVMLATASRVIGYNIKHFDYRVLQPYMRSLKLASLPTLDLMEEPTTVLGYRPRLNDLARATLGVAKSGSGLKALEWYAQGKFEELEKYCLDDVAITRDLYEYGVQHGFIYTFLGIVEELHKIPVSWKRVDAVVTSQYSLFS